MADPRILGLIRGWLRAGVLEGDAWSETVEGTSQGAGISPMLANSFCTTSWTCGSINGESGMTWRVVIVRYADDFVMGFQYEADARKMVIDLRERLATFGLMLHEEKTRLIEFGRLRPNDVRRAVTGGSRRLPSSVSRTIVRGAGMAV